MSNMRDYLKYLKSRGMSGAGFSQGASGSIPVAGTGTGANAGAQQQVSYKVSENTIYSIKSQDKMTIEISVDELDIKTIEVGSKVQVTLDALSGQSFEGVIASIGSEGTYSTGNTKYTVSVTIDRTEKMMTGMNALISIDTSSTEECFTVPVAALIEKNGKTYVYTTYDEKEETLGGLKEVTTGRSNGTDVEISGLEATDKVYYRYADSIEYTF